MCACERTCLCVCTCLCVHTYLCYPRVSNYVETLSSYRLSETKEIRTLVHYPQATLKTLCCCLAAENKFLRLRLGMCAAGHPFLLCINELWMTHPPACSHVHCSCQSAPVVLLFSLASQMFCGPSSLLRFFYVLQYLMVNAFFGAWCAALNLCACCLGEPRARASVMKRGFQYFSIYCQ